MNLNQYGQSGWREPSAEFSLRAAYRQKDFPYWLKFLPFEELWDPVHLNDSIRTMLTETEVVLVKAKEARLTLEGIEAFGRTHFTAKEWVVWLIQGEQEMALNHIKRNYLTTMEGLSLKPDPCVKIKPNVLDRGLITYIVREVERLCP